MCCTSRASSAPRRVGLMPTSVAPLSAAAPSSIQNSGTLSSSTPTWNGRVGGLVREQERGPLRAAGDELARTSTTRPRSAGRRGRRRPGRERGRRSCSIGSVSLRHQLPPPPPPPPPPEKPPLNPLEPDDDGMLAYIVPVAVVPKSSTALASTSALNGWLPTYQPGCRAARRRCPRTPSPTSSCSRTRSRRAGTARRCRAARRTGRARLPRPRRTAAGSRAPARASPSPSRSARACVRPRQSSAMPVTTTRAGSIPIDVLYATSHGRDRCRSRARATASRDPPVARLVGPDAVPPCVTESSYIAFWIFSRLARNLYLRSESFTVLRSSKSSCRSSCS